MRWLAALAVAAALAGTAASASPVLVTHGPRNRMVVALTFDADMTYDMLRRLRAGEVPGQWYDRRILVTLEKTHTPATIFLTGLWTLAHPDVVRWLARYPKMFELENHSWDHAAWKTPCYGLPTVTTVREKRAELERAARIISRVAGRRPRYFRFPGGCQSDGDVRLVASLGEQPLGWDVESGDAFQPDPRVIVGSTLTGVRPGSIVVMHIVGPPNTPATADALPTIIRSLKAHGYRFVTLHQLLGH